MDFIKILDHHISSKIHFRRPLEHEKIALAATIVTITVAKMSSSSSEAESPDIKPKVRRVRVDSSKAHDW